MSESEGEVDFNGTDPVLFLVSASTGVSVLAISVAIQHSYHPQRVCGRASHVWAMIGFALMPANAFVYLGMRQLRSQRGPLRNQDFAPGHGILPRSLEGWAYSLAVIIIATLPWSLLIVGGGILLAVVLGVVWVAHALSRSDSGRAPSPTRPSTGALVRNSQNESWGWAPEARQPATESSASRAERNTAFLVHHQLMESARESVNTAGERLFGKRRD